MRKTKKLVSLAVAIAVVIASSISVGSVVYAKNGKATHKQVKKCVIKATPKKAPVQKKPVQVVAKKVSTKNNVKLLSSAPVHHKIYVSASDKIGCDVLFNKFQGISFLQLDKTTMDITDIISNCNDKNVQISNVGNLIIDKTTTEKLEQKGYKHIVKLSDKDNYIGELAMNDCTQVKKGTPIIIINKNNCPKELCENTIDSIRQYPILICSQSFLKSKTREYIRNINPTNIYLIGNSSVLSNNIETQLKIDVPNSLIQRLNGQNTKELSLHVQKTFLKNVSQEIDNNSGAGLEKPVLDNPLLEKLGDIDYSNASMVSYSITSVSNTEGKLIVKVTSTSNNLNDVGKMIARCILMYNKEIHHISIEFNNGYKLDIN